MSVVAVTGASGFVGRAVVAALAARGDRVIALGRSPATEGLPANVESRRFDPNDTAPNPEAFEGADAVVHLSGETVAGRWTSEKKQRILDSRVVGTNNLIASLAACSKRPSALVSASAVGYYGSRGDEPLFEKSAPGADFLADVVVRWEAGAHEAEALGIRTVCLRTAIVLGNGGALQQMKLPFLFGAGGPLGSGRQFVPWIHLDDMVALYLFALDHEELRGPINAVAPDYATNARFGQSLGAALARPALLPAPAFALRAVLGEFAGSILASQLVIPAVAKDAGFRWSFPHLEPALAQIFNRPRSANVRIFRGSQVVPRPIDEVFAFFSSPRNLERITPPILRFKVLNDTGPLERGTTYEYAISLRGIPMRWKTMIAEVAPRERFEDVQLHGPYALWRHVHTFRPVDGGVEIDDAVDYLLPFAPIGDLAGPFVRSDVEEIFRFRKGAIAEAFGP
jgi:uncharacterized protein (TIGR01777 family)